jgi:outer membrane protein assembly factor BamB
VPDREPKARLEPGDIIVAGGGGLYRLDTALNETTIAFGGHVERARGLAVSQTGEIYVASVACRKGAVVRVDPVTGTQTVIASGFRTTVGIAVDRDGTVLVSDEHPVEGRWGQLFRFDFVKGQSSVEHSFGADSVPTSIDFDRKSGEMVIASKKVYRMTSEGPRLVGLDVTNVHALAFAPTGELFMAEYDGGPVVQLDWAARKISKTYQGFPTIWSIAISKDGKNVLVGSGSGGNAALHIVPISGAASRILWRPRSSEGVGVFVTVVGEVGR